MRLRQHEPMKWLGTLVEGSCALSLDRIHRPEIAHQIVDLFQHKGVRAEISGWDALGTQEIRLLTLRAP
jgi:hypothetical protein